MAVLDHPPPEWKGFVSEDDIRAELDEDLLDEASMCLARGGWPKAEDVAHKYYVVASWLQDVCPILKGWSYGRLLSIVKCSAQTNGSGVLGHRNGLLVPYASSEDCERRVNAVTGRPTAVAADEQYVHTWDELRHCLSEHLLKQTGPSMFRAIEVSKVKSMFRSTFHRELSETVFGHQNLTKLLTDDRIGPEFVLEAVAGQKPSSKPLRKDLNKEPSGHTYVLKYTGSVAAKPYTPPPAAPPAALEERPSEESPIQLQ